MGDQTAEHPERSAVDNFASRIAHELRNILNNVGLSLQFLELTLDMSEPKTERAISRMRDEVAKLRRLADELPARARDAEQSR
jgi:signal transduction histidine kinase